MDNWKFTTRFVSNADTPEGKLEEAKQFFLNAYGDAWWGNTLTIGQEGNDESYRSMMGDFFRKSADRMKELADRVETTGQLAKWEIPMMVGALQCEIDAIETIRQREFYLAQKESLTTVGQENVSDGLSEAQEETLSEKMSDSTSEEEMPADGDIFDGFVDDEPAMD